MLGWVKLRTESFLRSGVKWDWLDARPLAQGRQRTPSFHEGNYAVFLKSESKALVPHWSATDWALSPRRRAEMPPRRRLYGVAPRRLASAGSLSATASTADCMYLARHCLAWLMLMW